ncbi:phospholipase A2 inhibitor 31 kDa subunit-like [Pyxicephalus adspersus]|uniref:UPAR/Ly6 domain-containing protein n=1 Tax=Pyxicephalus adspersus TaxID=30357 RepID=A0AAV2ZN95_PYXAD|nr:TPA: hypothetical protein GDO54_003293 [Pyxicephalus adspersus]
MCYTCNAVSSETCRNVEEECPEDCSCMTISEEFGMEGKTFRSISKKCAKKWECNKYIYANVGQDVYVKVYKKCCTGPRCNSGFFEMLANQTQGKGISCPQCYAFNSTDGCTANTSLACMGEDDQCIRFRGSMKLPCGNDIQFSAQGCSSKLSCNSDYRDLIGLKITKKLENKCYVPKIPHQPPKNSY